MGQIFRADTIKTLVKLSGTTLQMPAANFITVGGQQYRNALAITINLTTTGANGLDSGALGANKLYAVHAVVSAGVLAFTASLSSNLVPAGFAASKVVGYFDTNNSSQVQTVGSDSGHGKLGDVKHSVLTEAQFQSENGPGWILADSRSISGSRLHTLQGFTTAIEARGRVLRGKDNGAGVNPDGDTALQTTQADQFGSHGHSVNDPGHSHTYGIYLGSFPGGGSPSSNYVPHGLGEIRGTSGSGTGVSINSNGGSETRMRNVTTNIFVKVN